MGFLYNSRCKIRDYLIVVFANGFLFGNVLVPATVLFSGGELINLALCVRILDNHLRFDLTMFSHFCIIVSEEWEKVSHS